jgi:hypothetical protein
LRELQQRATEQANPPSGLQTHRRQPNRSAPAD